MQRVVIESGGIADLYCCTALVFPRRWLAVDEDDGQIRRRLKLERGGETTNYLVKVFTSDIKGAGTDANV